MSIRFLLSALLLVVTSHIALANNDNEKSTLTLGHLNDNKGIAHTLCYYQLSDSKNKNIEHFAVGDVCPLGGGQCVMSGAININNKQLVLKEIKNDIRFGLYENSEYFVVAIYKVRDCKKQSCKLFDTDAVFIVSAGTDRKIFEMQGSCPRD